MSSESSSTSEDEQQAQAAQTQRPIPLAKKSTAQATAYVTRRQAAKAKESQKLQTEKFLDDFDPDTSCRERKKLTNKINSMGKRNPGSVYDENGIHIASNLDLCDCLVEDCEGCFFDCLKCGSKKCGLECRVNRKYMYEQCEYHGFDHVIKNKFLK